MHENKEAQCVHLRAHFLSLPTCPLCMGSLTQFWFLSSSSRIACYPCKDIKIWRLTWACHRWISQTSNWGIRGHPLWWQNTNYLGDWGCCKPCHYYHLTWHSSWGTALLCGRGAILVADALLFCEFCVRQQTILLMWSWCACLCSHTYLWSVCQGCFELRSP